MFAKILIKKREILYSSTIEYIQVLSKEEFTPGTHLQCNNMAYNLKYICHILHKFKRSFERFAFLKFYIIFVLEIPIFVVMTKIDESDLKKKAIKDLKRKICSTFVISVDRILECANYKRSDTKSGWLDNDDGERVLNFLTSISNFIMKTVYI